MYAHALAAAKRQPLRLRSKPVLLNVCDYPDYRSKLFSVLKYEGVRQHAYSADRPIACD